MDPNMVRDILQQALSQLQQYQQPNLTATAVPQMAPPTSNRDSPSVGGFSFTLPDRQGVNPSTSSTSAISGQQMAPLTTTRAPFSVGRYPFTLPDRHGVNTSSPSTSALSGQQRHGVFTPNATFRHSSSALGLQELRQLRAPYSPAQNRRTTGIRSPATEAREKLLRLFCLGSPLDLYSPNAAYKSDLEMAGLGEKSVPFNKSQTTDDVKDLVKQAYPLIGLSDFELLRASGGGAGKRLLRINEFQPIPSTSTLIEIGGRSLVYVRPSTALLPDEEEAMGDHESETSSTYNTRSSSTQSPNGGHANPGFNNANNVPDRAPQAASCDDSRPCSSQQAQLHSFSTNIRDADYVMGSNSSSNQAVGHLYNLQTSASFTYPNRDFAMWEDFRDAVHNDNPGETLILMERARLLDRIIELYCKDLSLNIHKKPRIAFVGEQGIDLGGLTKEFFSESQTSMITQRYLDRYPLFDGQGDCKLPSADQVLLHSGVFKALGKFMAHSYINTGVAMPGISTAVMEYLVSPTIDNDTCYTFSMEDIANVESRAVLSKLENWSGETPLQVEDSQLLQNFFNQNGIHAEFSLQNKCLLIQTLFLHEIINIRRGQLDELRTAFWFSGVGPFLAERQYLWDSAFPKLMNHQYEPSVVLARMDFTGFGVESDRVKVFMEDYIQSMNSDRLRLFLKAVTGWPYLTNDRIKIDVGRHNRFFISTCFETVEIPDDMTNILIQSCFENAMNTNYFGAS